MSGSGAYITPSKENDMRYSSAEISSSNQPSSADPTRSAYRWVILALAASAFLMAFVSRFAWPPLMPAVMPAMNIGRAEGLAYMSAFYLGYIATQIPGGVMADRFGPRLVLSAALFFQGLGTFGLGFTSDYQTGFVLRVLCGLGGGCVYSSCFKAVATWFSPAGRGLAIAVLMSAPTIGVAAPNFLMPVLESGLGWQGAFRAVGLGVTAAAALIMVFMRDVQTVAGPRRSFMVGLKYILGNRNLILMGLVGFCGLWVQIGFGSVGNDYLVTVFGLNLKAAGGVMVFYGLAGLAVSLAAGWLSGKLPRHKKSLTVVCFLLMAGFCFLFGRLDSMTAVLVGAGLIGMAVSFANAIQSILIADFTPTEWLATAGGVTNSIFQVGALLSPLIIGRAIGGGDFSPTWLLLGAGALGGAALAALLKTRA